MAKSIELVGQRDFVRNMSKFENNLVSLLVVACEMTQAKVVNHAKANHGAEAHKRGRFVTRTETLVKSILPGPVSIDSKGVECVVEARAPYAGYVEGDERWKTTDIGVYPFLKPAVEANRKYFNDRMKEALKKAKR